MPTNQLDIKFTAAQMTAIKDAAATVNTNFPFAVNLTKSERTSLPNIESERYPYVQRAIEIHAPNNPNLVSGFAGTLAEATTDWTFVKQCDELIPLFEVILEKLRDTRQLGGSEAYAFLREFYASAQRGAENNVPGADAIVDDIAPLFEKQGSQGQPPKI